VVVLGLDAVSGKEEVCERLCAALGCTIIDLEAVIKAEVAAATDLGGEIAACAEQGKILPNALAARAIKAALDAGPGGMYLLLGQHKSMELETFEKHVGLMPRLAVLFELSDADARRQLAAKGLDEAAVTTRLRSFHLQTGALTQTLEGRGLLRRIDASASHDDAFASARAHFEQLGVAAPSASAKPAATTAAKYVLAIGHPGVDVAALCSRLAHQMADCIHLTMSEVMRSEIDSQSSLGMSVSQMVRAGKVIPTSTLIEMIHGAVAKHPTATYLLDGFPRTVGAFTQLEDQLGPCKRAILFEGGPPDSGEVDESVQRQMRTFTAQTLPVATTIEGRGHLRRVDATTDADTTFAAACTAFKD